MLIEEIASRQAISYSETNSLVLMAHNKEPLIYANEVWRNPLWPEMKEVDAIDHTAVAVS